MSTLENDGSVDGDPCQACEGRLALRHVRHTGGWFLGCTNYSKGCTFTMNPNPHQMEQLAEERAKRREERARKREERDRIARAELEARRRKEESMRPRYCDECFSRLSNVDVQAGRTVHSHC